MFITILIIFNFHESYSTEKLTAFDIMQNVEKNTRSSSSFQQNKFVIIRKNQERLKEFIFYRKTDGSINKTLLKITKPLKDKSISLLTINDNDKKTDQWLFLPELNKVNPILSKNKGQPFLNSDFYYEDFEEKDIGAYFYTMEKMETFNQKKCYIIKAVSKDKSMSVYSHKRLWVDTVDYIILKTEFYESNKLTKTLISDKIQKDSGLFTVMHSTMISEKNPDHKTMFIVNAIQSNIQIDDYIFTIQNLSRR